jgi:hypothetical protein
MAQNKNGPIIGLAIFSLLSVVFAVLWYMMYSDNVVKTTQVISLQAKEEKATLDLRANIEVSNVLKDKIGVGRTMPLGADGENGTVSDTVDALLKRHGGDGTGAPPNLLNTVNSLASESNKNASTAENRLDLASKQAVDHQQDLAVKDAEIAKFKDAATKAESELIRQETTHSEEMGKVAAQLAEVRAAKSQIEIEKAKNEEQSRREIEELLDNIAQNRTGLVALRGRLRELEDKGFSRPDGIITNVDHSAELCYLNIGSADGLRTGVTFSVYNQNHSGVGRTNTSDIKGSVEVTEILGAHSSKARLVEQKPSAPINANDPVYSPIFSAGETLEIAVAGQVKIKGMNRGEFRRMVLAAGAKIAVEVGEDGKFTDGRGEVISEQEARARITSRTRYLVIGDLGDPSTTSEESGLEALYLEIRKNTEILKAESENLGIYPIGLSSFLEHIGYSRKQVAWTPENGQPFPGKLANGAKSTQANSSFGARESSAVISGQFSGRSKSTVTSGGTTSKAYSN